MSWVGSLLPMPNVFKAQSGSVPAWGKRMGGWTLENVLIMGKRGKVQKNEWPRWPPENTGKPLCLRCGFGSMLVDSWAKSHGLPMELVCVFAVALRHWDQCQTHQAAFKELSVAVMDRRDEKATSVSAFPMFVFQRCHLMKIWDLITFSSVFILSVLFPDLMPNQTLLLWS